MKIVQLDSELSRCDSLLDQLNLKCFGLPQKSAFVRNVSNRYFTIMIVYVREMFNSRTHTEPALSILHKVVNHSIYCSVGKVRGSLGDRED